MSSSSLTRLILSKNLLLDHLSVPTFGCSKASNPVCLGGKSELICGAPRGSRAWPRPEAAPPGPRRKNSMPVGTDGLEFFRKRRGWAGEESPPAPAGHRQDLRRPSADLVRKVREELYAAPPESKKSCRLSLALSRDPPAISDSSLFRRSELKIRNVFTFAQNKEETQRVDMMPFASSQNLRSPPDSSDFPRPASGSFARWLGGPPPQSDSSRYRSTRPPPRLCLDFAKPPVEKGLPSPSFAPPRSETLEIFESGPPKRTLRRTPSSVSVSVSASLDPPQRSKSPEVPPRKIDFYVPKSSPIKGLYLRKSEKSFGHIQQFDIDRTTRLRKFNLPSAQLS